MKNVILLKKSFYSLRLIETLSAKKSKSALLRKVKVNKFLIKSKPKLVICWKVA